MDIGDYYTIPRVCHCGSSRVRIVGIVGAEVIYQCAKCKDPASCTINTFLDFIYRGPECTHEDSGKCTCDIVQLWNTGCHEEGCNERD
jgi:hypothetical protein